MLPTTLLSNVLSVKHNILIVIDSAPRACISDFGFSTIIPDLESFTASSSASIGGTTRWMSPKLVYLEHRMVTSEALCGFAPPAPREYHGVTRRFLDFKRPRRPKAVKGMSIEAVRECLAPSTRTPPPDITGRRRREGGERFPGEWPSDPPSEIYSDAGQVESSSGPNSLGRPANLPPCILPSRKQEPQE